MAKGYKVNDPISIRIRCDGDPATDNPTIVIKDEVDGVHATLTIGSGLTQVGTTRIVKGTFTPDALGEWSAEATDDAGLDLVKAYSVGNYSITSIGAKVATLEAKQDAQDVAIATNQAALVAGQAAAAAALAAQDAQIAGNHVAVLAAITAVGSGGGGHFG
ncbi:MAG: hypothetical protein GY934_13520 [Gammaproteobacteria bacterium]|nr:hypothetical protein [Gammaproteobacteria bacterium]